MPPSRDSPLSPSQVTDLLGFILRATYFSYNGSFYEQQEGAAMGSPVSAVIANLYMEVFEEQALQSCDPQLRPRVWKRYVDDTFVISTQASVDGLLAHLNNQQPTIRFTMEAEKDGKIAFLDTLMHRESDGRLTTTVYRKATHTDQYLAYNSHHPRSVKRGVVKCLYDRAHHIVTQPNGKVSERQHLASAHVSNGYPLPFLQSHQDQTASTEGAVKPQSHGSTTLRREGFTDTPALPRTTRHTDSLQIRHNSMQPPGTAEGPSPSWKTRWGGMQDPVRRVRCCIHRGNRKTSAEEDEGARERRTPHALSDLSGSGTRQCDRTWPQLERCQVH